MGSQTANENPLNKNTVYFYFSVTLIPVVLINSTGAS